MAHSAVCGGAEKPPWKPRFTAGTWTTRYPNSLTPIDAQLALDGIDEYSQEFLPNMLPAVTHPAPVSSLRLSATDLDDSRVLPLIPTGDEQNHDASRAELIGSASDLLLWMWNRVAADKLTVRGNDAVVSWWKSLVI